MAQAMEGKSREDLQAQLLAAMAEQTGMDSQQISDYLTGAPTGISTKWSPSLSPSR